MKASLDAVLTADRNHLWHPYTAMDDYRRDHSPLVVTAAAGPYLELAGGRRILDGNGSWWVSTLGHNHPRLVRALIEQAQVLCHCSLAGTTHEAAALLAEELAAVTPRGLDQVFFSDDGSTAVEVAIKMALQYQQQKPGAGASTRKTRFLALEGAFHGDSIGAASLGGVEVFRRPFGGVLFECVHVPSPADDAGGCAPAWSDAFDVIATLLENEHDTIAALFLEPVVQAAGGMRIYPTAYLRAVRDLCDRHDVLLVFDEVFTGYGRLGSMWAGDLAEVAPDLLCLAKGFTAGVLPMAATVTSRKVLAAFDGGVERAFLYGHSFSGNPLGAAVAREVLAIYRDEHIVAGVAARHAIIRARLEAMRGGPLGALIRDARALGSIGALDLRARRSAGGAGSGYTASVGWSVYAEALRRGAYLRPLGDVVYLSPALNIPLPDLEKLLDVMEESLEAVAGAAG